MAMGDHQAERNSPVAGFELIPVRRFLAAWLALCVAGILLYAPSLTVPRLLDDYLFAFIFQGIHPGDLPALVTPVKGMIWVRPVTSVAMWLDFQMFHSWLPGYRMMALIWYSLAAALLIPCSVYCLRLNTRTAYFAAGLYMLYPGSFQTVLFPSAKTDTLYWPMLEAGLLCYWAWRFQRGRRAGLWAASGLYLLALLTKETSIVFPLLIIGMELLLPAHQSDRSIRKSALGVGSLVLITLGYLVFRMAALSGLGGYSSSTQLMPGSVRDWWRVVSCLGFHLPAITFLPVQFDPFRGVAAAETGFACFLYLALGSASRQSRHLRQTILAGMGLVLILCLPVIPVIWKRTLFATPPRYISPGAGGVCIILAVLMLSPRVKRWMKTLVILILLSWIPVLFHNQNVYRAAAEIPASVIRQLTPYCDDLARGGQVIVSEIPAVIGTVNVEHHDPVLSVINLEVHRQCGLTPPFEAVRGFQLQPLVDYMNSFPGRVSTVLNPEDADRPGFISGNPVIRLRFQREQRNVSE